MKGLHGLILAVGLGIAGALFNFAYLAKKSGDVEIVSYAGIASSKNVARGERLVEESLEELKIPNDWRGNLDDFAIRWTARSTILGQRVWRPLPGGTLVLKQDLKTPPPELAIGQDEKGYAVPIDPRRSVPSLINPGDTVTFIAPAGVVEMPSIATPAAKPDAVKPSEASKPGDRLQPVSATAPVSAEGLELIGPFRVLSLGNRLAARDVMQAAQATQLQENVMIIAIKLVPHPSDPSRKEMEPQAVKLMRVLNATNAQPLGVVLDPRPAKTE